MLVVSTLFILVGLGSTLPSYKLEKEWKQFQLAYNRNYQNSAELRYRKEIFKKNLEGIKKHNEEYEAGLHSYMQGVNQFTDLTFEEVQKKFLTHKENLPRQTRRGTSVDLDVLKVSDNDIPASIDFREKGYVTTVKNQENCGACWAFSVVGAIEGQLYEATKKLVSLSAQQLVDCSESNLGCSGGLLQEAFEDLEELDGIATEESYPYIGEDDDCQFEKDMAVAEVTDFKILPHKENALKTAVALKGPISVAIQVTEKFLKYRQGIFYDRSCCPDKICVNHAVLVVGYGTDNTTRRDYWIVKNSWGTDWGDNGYIKMIRNRRNNCNIASYGIYPIISLKGNISSFAIE